LVKIEANEGDNVIGDDGAIMIVQTVRKVAATEFGY
jgi:hypothetical protein